MATKSKPNSVMGNKPPTAPPPARGNPGLTHGRRAYGASNGMQATGTPGPRRKFDVKAAAKRRISNG